MRRKGLLAPAGDPLSQEICQETPLAHPSALYEVHNNTECAWSGWAALTQKARGNMSRATTDGHSLMEVTEACDRDVQAFGSPYI